jgi:hypothetical protein
VIAFANNFLAGALITLLIPGLTFIVITSWYIYSVLRLAERRRGEGTPRVPQPAHPETAGLTATGQDPPAVGAP